MCHPEFDCKTFTYSLSACSNKDGQQQVQLVLIGKEASDYLNFVVKDTSSGTWYDQGGTNFHIPLTGSVATMSIDEQIPDAELPDLPGELCGIWSYIKWEQAGCPNRNEQQNQQAYKEAIAVGLCCSQCTASKDSCCQCGPVSIAKHPHYCIAYKQPCYQLAVLSGHLCRLHCGYRSMTLLSHWLKCMCTNSLYQGHNVEGQE